MDKVKTKDMKLTKDQKNAVIQQIGSAAGDKLEALSTEKFAELAKLDDPYLVFFRQLAQDKAKAQAFCASVVAWLEEFKRDTEDRTDASKSRDLYEEFFYIPVRNAERAGKVCDAGYDLTNRPVLMVKHLDAMVAARNKKASQIEAAYDAREKKVLARRDELNLQVQLMNVPDKLLELLDTFRKQEF